MRSAGLTRFVNAAHLGNQEFRGGGFMRHSAPTARTLWVPAGLFSLLLSAIVGSGCADVHDDGLGGPPSADDGSLTGELAAYTSDDLEGHSETRYAIRDRLGGERTIVFDSLIRAVDLQPNTQVRVWGKAATDATDVFHVTHVERVEPEVFTSALKMAAPYNPRSFAFVLVDLGAGINTTSDAAMGRLITGADSIRNYYLSDSYGTQDVTAQVVGPLKYTINGCGTSQMATDLRGMVPGTFQHYLWYFGSRQSACGWTGLASVGTPDKPSRDTWYNASTSCVVLVQEPGHNFGMQHSSSLTCPNSSMADDPAGCTASEYGDPFDPMGGGCRHMNAWQKQYQGWFGGCNGVTVTSSGTFTLLPIEQRCDGVQYLKIPAPKTRMFNRPAAGGGGATVETFSHYYVELRTGQDFDGTLGNRTALTPQVLVHIGGDVRARNQRGLHTFLLDMTPATTGRTAFTDAALAAGKTFSDPAGGLDITVTSVSAGSATIQVNIPNGNGGPTCIDDTPFTAPGPGQESCSASITGAAGAPGTGAAGTSGAAGAGNGAAGAGNGAAGTGGRAGSGGSNTAGMAGMIGATGAAGSISTGMAGATGAAGTGPAGMGTAGAPPVTGAAGDGAPITGAAGVGSQGGAGTSGAAAPGEKPGEITGHGCACDMTNPTPGGGAGAMLLLALALARRRRASAKTST
jgi:MYXO-CTERM domain-containing protein